MRWSNRRAIRLPVENVRIRYLVHREWDLP